MTDQHPTLANSRKLGLRARLTRLQPSEIVCAALAAGAIAYIAILFSGNL